MLAPDRVAQQPPKFDEGLVEGYRWMGATDEDIEKLRAKARAAEEEAHFDVWDDNWPSLMFFLKVATQWRHVGTMVSIVRTGLDATAVRSRMEAQRLPQDEQDQLWADLDLMEREVLKADGEQRRAAAANNWRD